MSKQWLRTSDIQKLFDSGVLNSISNDAPGFNFAMGTIQGVSPTSVLVDMDASPLPYEPIIWCSGLPDVDDRVLLLYINKRYTIIGIEGGGGSSGNAFLDSRPVGSWYFTDDPMNPGLLYGGTWVAVSQGRVPIGMGSNGVTNYTTVGATGGTDAVELTSAQNGQHTHAFTGTAGNTGTQSASHSHTFTGSAVNSGNNSADHTHGYNDATPQAHTHGLSAGHGRITTSGNDVRYRYKSVSSWTANYRMTGSSSGSNSNTHTDGIELGGTTDSTTNTSDAARTTGNQSASHNHSVTAAGTIGNQSASHSHSFTPGGTNGSSGSGDAHENRMPYVTVYIWKRTA